MRTFQSFEVDPLAAITATLSHFDHGEEAWLQVLIRPASKQWSKKSERYLAKTRAGNPSLWTLLSQGTTVDSKLNERTQLRLSSAELKAQKMAYEYKLSPSFDASRLGANIMKIGLQKPKARRKKSKTRIVRRVR